MNPLLPSAWTAKAVQAWGDGLGVHGAFYFAVLMSNALFGLLLGFRGVGRLFYSGWSYLASSRAEQYQIASTERQAQGIRESWLQRIADHLPLGTRADRALMVKDTRLFWRDPTQWSQFMIFFGLLGVYVLNLRNVGYDFTSPFWGTMIRYLNLTACALTLSTLTTRFVFPQFSLEGKRIWILGLIPMEMHRIVMSKYWSSFGLTSIITGSMMIVSSQMLQLNGWETLFFVLAIIVMSGTLTAIAMGLGTLYPNLKEDNPSKIVSGFGGTLCLILSFLYIALFIGALTIPVGLTFTKHWFSDSTLRGINWGCYGFAGVLSLGGTLILLRLARNKVKNLEF